MCELFACHIQVQLACCCYCFSTTRSQANRNLLYQSFQIIRTSYPRRKQLEWLLWEALWDKVKFNLMQIDYSEWNDWMPTNTTDCSPNWRQEEEMKKRFASAFWHLKWKNILLKTDVATFDGAVVVSLFVLTQTTTWRSSRDWSHLKDEKSCCFCSQLITKEQSLLFVDNR